MDQGHARRPQGRLRRARPQGRRRDPRGAGRLVGDEFVDATRGGVLPENIDDGRAVSRMEAEGAIPAGAAVLDVREDPAVVIDSGNGSCADSEWGAGWGWGSLLISLADGSIGELVYLYVGVCNDPGDAEAFFYSEDTYEVCPPPA